MRKFYQSRIPRTNLWEGKQLCHTPATRQPRRQCKVKMTCIFVASHHNHEFLEAFLYVFPIQMRYLVGLEMGENASWSYLTVRVLGLVL